MAKKSFCTTALEFCRSVDLKYKCSKIPPPSNSKDMHARRDIQEVQPQLPLLCRRISSVLTVSRVGCWSAPDTYINKTGRFQRTWHFWHGKREEKPCRLRNNTWCVISVISVGTTQCQMAYRKSFRVLFIAKTTLRNV